MYFAPQNYLTQFAGCNAMSIADMLHCYAFP